MTRMRSIIFGGLLLALVGLAGGCGSDSASGPTKNVPLPQGGKPASEGVSKPPAPPPLPPRAG
jgi:hypothetical protein